MKNNIISLDALRTLKNATLSNPGYEVRITMMQKHELLEEMVQFQEERTRKGSLDVEMIVRGRILFAALQSQAETEHLRLLTRSYLRHLNLELEEHLRVQKRV